MRFPEQYVFLSESNIFINSYLHFGHDINVPTKKKS